ncbi:MAG: hypothetical protein AB7G39_10550 [Alphaproteobacteria bacterium]
MLKKNPVSVMAFCLLGDMFLMRENFRLARQNYAQANAIQPNNPEIQARMDAVEQAELQKREAASAAVMGGGNGQDSSSVAMFSLVVTPSGLGGSVAMMRFLSAHPELLSVHIGEIDAAIEAGTEADLLLKYRTYIDKGHCRRVALVQHGRIAGISAPDDVAARLRKVANANAFVQIVRHPLSQLVSQHAHLLYDSACHYDFGRSGLPWLDGFEFPSPNNPFPDRPGRNASLDHIAEAASRFCVRPYFMERYFHVGSLHAMQFDNWEVIDFEELLPGRIGATMRRLYTMAGVDPAFSSGLFEEPQNTLIQRFMGRSWAKILIAGQHISMGLTYRGAARNWFDSDFTEIAWIDETAAIALGLEGRPLALQVSTHEWLRLPKHIRIGIAESGRIQEFFERIFAPLWAENYLRISSILAPHRIAAVEGDLRTDFRRYLGDDTKRFLDRHSRIHPFWKGIDEFLALPDR